VHLPPGGSEWALFYGAGFVGFGCWVFRYEKMRHVQGRRHRQPIGQPKLWWDHWLAGTRLRCNDRTYHAFWYSLDAFVPIVGPRCERGLEAQIPLASRLGLSRSSESRARC